MFLSSGCVLTTFLTSYITDVTRLKSHKNIMFLVQAGTFLCFQAERSSATHSSAYDLTVMGHFFNYFRLDVLRQHVLRNAGLLYINAERTR